MLTGQKKEMSIPLWLTILLFGSMGAITWAIRGTAGWGGVDGTIIPGLTWGLLWYYISAKQGLDARGHVLWLAFGIALGGELGYGQYVSWIRGLFSTAEGTLSVSPAIGYLWFVICGIGWAAPGGILLGWTLGGRKSPATWAIHSLWLALLLVILFAWPLVDWLSFKLAGCCPALLFPNADLDIYRNLADKHLARTIYTNTQNMAALLWWLGALLIALLQRDRTTLVTGLMLGLGFGAGFALSAIWCLGYGFAPSCIDWWKMWELTAGFFLGSLYAIVLRLFLLGKLTDPQSEKPVALAKSAAWHESLFLLLAGGSFIFFMSFEYFPETGYFLILLFALSLLSAHSPRVSGANSVLVIERRREIQLLYAVFLLVFMLLHGGSERAGVVLGLYDESAVQQYNWPIERMLLFLPWAILVTAGFVRENYNRILQKSGVEEKNLLTSHRTIDLMTFIAFVGALSIWPAKIGILYALFLMVGLAAFNRLERRLEMEGIEP